MIVGPLLAGVLIASGAASPSRTPSTPCCSPSRSRCGAAAAAAAAGGRGRAAARRGRARRWSTGFGSLRTQPVLLMTFVVDIIAMVFAMAAGGVPGASQTAVRRPANASAGCSPAISIGALIVRAVVGLGRPGRPAGRRGARARSPSGAWRWRVRARPPSSGSPSLCLAVAGAADMVSAVLRQTMLQWPPRRRCAAGCRACSSSSSPAGRGWATCGRGAGQRGRGHVAMVSGGWSSSWRWSSSRCVVPSFWLFRASVAGAARRSAGRRSPAPGGPTDESPPRHRNPASRLGCATGDSAGRVVVRRGRRRPARSATSAS